MRAAKTLRPIMRAFGRDYLCDRIDYFGGASAGPEQERFEQELEIYKNSGFAGLPGIVHEPPF